MKKPLRLPIAPWAAVAGVVGCAVLVWVGRRWPHLWVLPDNSPEGLLLNPSVELLKLMIAAGIGALITGVYQHGRPKTARALASAHSQILFCIAGALAMIIIGNSTARAFGAFGVASIVRFRSALRDPEDATVMFLLIGLGMAVGRGILEVAALGTVFLCLLLWLFEYLKVERPRSVMLELTAAGRDFPSAHVQQVFARNVIAAEPREGREGEEKTVKYHATLAATASIEELSAQLMADGNAGIKSVKWDRRMNRPDRRAPKKD